MQRHLLCFCLLFTLAHCGMELYSIGQSTQQSLLLQPKQRIVQVSSSAQVLFVTEQGQVIVQEYVSKKLIFFSHRFLHANTTLNLDCFVTMVSAAAEGQKDMILCSNHSLFMLDNSYQFLTLVNTSHIAANISQVAACTNFYHILTTEGRVYSWGMIHGVVYDTPTELAIVPESITDIQCSFMHLVMRTSQGKVFAFGINSNGDLGNYCSCDSRILQVMVQHNSEPMLLM